MEEAPMVRYQHRQFATAIVASLVGMAALCAILGVYLPPQGRGVAAFGGLFLLFALLFYSLTVEVTGESLHWWFGPGIISKKVALSSILGAEATATKVIEGWGIHLTGRGWLYNVSGFGAVLVTQKDGKRFLIGSDEPERLAEAINAARL
jgi:drug/metabolite transporter superfamily protein YnfA